MVAADWTEYVNAVRPSCKRLCNIENVKLSSTDFDSYNIVKFISLLRENLLLRIMNVFFYLLVSWNNAEDTCIYFCIIYYL